MPSPNRSSNGHSESESKIAYTRWEPQEALTEDPDVASDGLQEESQNNNTIPFHHFEEEGISIIHRRSQQTQNKITWSSWYDFGIKTLGILIIIGISWIVGFMTRWGVHHYYIDSMGHCITPVPYQYDPETAKFILEEVNYDSIKDFLHEFTSQSHQIGSQESYAFAQNMSNLWRDFGFPKVEISQVMNKIPRPNAKLRSGISIMDQNGQAVYNLEVSLEQDLISFTPGAIEHGRLVYGHYGRFEDLTTLQETYGLQFNNSVVMIKVNQMYHTGSMVRNAQLMGVKAVVLFPDPFPYILSKDQGQLGKLPSNVTVNTDVKFVPGDPNSPYLEGLTMPDIPVLGLSYDQAKEVLQYYTNSFGVSYDFWYGLPLNTSAELNFTAEVRVYRDDETVQLNNVIGTLPGR